MSSNDLTELKQKRLKWVEANRENGFDEGINRLLTELYPDNAHFIYELLQNAEDPQATEVTFKLTKPAVEFTHNGKRLFEFKDVESITSIGNSTKRDDETSIGKFGVGFKAVFAYTNTPEIHSGDFHFQIHDLVVPETKKVKQASVGKNKTRFVFPFDNPKKSSVLAASEVEKGLCALGDNTLLFLSHIRKINYSLPDGSQGSLERIDHENGRIEIRAKHPHSEETISHWLHFHKDVEVTDADGNNKNCRVAMAYQLEKVTDKNKDSETWKIIPVHGGGQVSIYFPAEKETSKLRFHIHAPFASTVARDTPENRLLINHLAELIVDSLTKICDQKMLVMGFLGVLPTPKDELAEFYEPIRTKIIEAFKTELLTPTKSGNHAAASALYRGSAKISDVIEDEDLLILTGYEIPLWASNAPQRNSREDNFLESLGIDKWDFEQLSEIFASTNKAKTESWLETKDDNWLRRFYVLLKDAKQHHEDNHYETWMAKNFPLVRVNSEDGVKHVVGNQAYFESLHGQISTDGIHIVKPEVYTKDNAKRDIDENAETFLESIGVRPFNEKAVIELRLQFYQLTPPTQITDEYYDDIKRFVSYRKENATEGSHYQRQADELFKSVRFLLGISDDKLYWKNATELCLDSPIMETGLGELFECHYKSRIYGEYAKNLTEDELKDFVEFLKAMDVMYELKRIVLPEYQARRNSQNPYANTNCKWTNTSVAVDYSIENLYNYLIAKNLLASRLIWDVIIKFGFAFGKARFKPNNNYSLKEVESSVIQILKNHAWIPTKSGEFRKPKAMTRDDLRDDFPFNNSNGLLTAIEFGKDSVVLAEARAEEERKQKEQQNANFKQRDMFAKELGAESLDEAEEAIKFLHEMKAQGKTLAEIRDILNPKKPDFEDDYSSNPERRAGKVQEAATDAPEKRTEMRERSVAVDNTETKKAAKLYLKDKYTQDKILYCQICNKEMPFKLSDGSYYFEVVQLISDTQKRHKENYIALCSTDAAKFQYANPSKDRIANLVSALIDDRSADDINDSDDDGNCFDIVLAGNIETLQFRRVHLMDLKAAIAG